MATKLNPSTNILTSWGLCAAFTKGNLKDNGPCLLEPQPFVTIHIIPPEDSYFAEEKYTYSIHKNFACHYSPFFNAAFNSGFKETETLEMELEDVYPVTFGILVNWIYKQTLEEQIGWVDDQATLLDLWLLADRLLIPQLQNQALTLLENVRGLQNPEGRAIPSHMFRPIYDNTSEDSPLRKYIAATWHNGVLDLDDPEDQRRYPLELLLDYENKFHAWGKLSTPDALGMEELRQFLSVRRVAPRIAFERCSKSESCYKF